MRADPRRTQPGKTAKSSWLSGLSESDRLLLIWVVASLTLMAGLLGAAGAAWLHESGAGPAARDTPHWVGTDTVRATSLDGDVIQAKVSLDAPDAKTRAWLSSRPHQVALVLQVGVSEFHNGGAGGAERVQRLGQSMQTRLNAYLADNQVPAVRAVVVEELVYSPH